MIVMAVLVYVCMVVLTYHYSSHGMSSFSHILSELCFFFFLETCEVYTPFRLSKYIYRFDIYPYAYKPFRILL